jgi:hypothetical protein
LRDFTFTQKSGKLDASEVGSESFTPYTEGSTQNVKDGYAFRKFHPLGNTARSRELRTSHLHSASKGWRCIREDTSTIGRNIILINPKVCGCQSIETESSNFNNPFTQEVDGTGHFVSIGRQIPQEEPLTKSKSLGLCYLANQEEERSQAYHHVAGHGYRISILFPLRNISLSQEDCHFLLCSKFSLDSRLTPNK